MTLQLVHNASSLDPATIEELATAMAEQTWVDMRVVPGGIAERVLVIGLLIRREEEEVEIEQWIEDEQGDIERRTHWIHAEEIWWIKPTQFQRGDELRPFEPKGKRQSADNALDAALRAVADHYGVPPDEVKAVATHRLDSNHYRYWVMLVYEELTGRKGSDVTTIFGYGSPQPLVSARDMVRKQKAEARLESMIRAGKGYMP